MASISTSIELYDKVSAPINRMITSINNMVGAYKSVEYAMDAGFDTAPINEARHAIDRTAEQIEEVEWNIRRSEQQQDNFNMTVREGSFAMDGLLGKTIALVGAYASLQTVQQVMNISDELTQTTARIDMMNDGLQTTPELVNRIYQSAQNARASFTDMAAVVAKFGNNARDAFSSSAEVVDFANLIQKQMVIAGASGAEASAAMLQLSQALGSGVLRGEELNSIFEQAPNIIQTIADYLDIPIGKIREMAMNGEISADIVKNAIFAAADEINSKFEQMPMTWNQVWTVMKNGALMQFQPVLDKINELANNQDFQTFASNAVGALATVAVVLLDIMNLVGMIGTFVSDNWSIIEPIIMGIVTALGLYAAYLGIVKLAEAIGTATKIAMCVAAYAHAAATGAEVSATVAATAAQYGLNTAMLACPLTWIIALIAAVVAAIYAVCTAIANLTNIANSGFGVITGGINVVIQFFKNLGLSVANIALGIGEAIGALCSNMMAAFSNAISGIQSWFYGLMSTALNVVSNICAALNSLPFVEFDYSGITAQADAYAAKSAEAAGYKESYTSVSDAFSEGYDTYDTFQEGWASDAFESGAAWGDGVTDKVSNAITEGFGTDSGIDTSNMFNGAGYEAGNYDTGSYGSSYDAGQIPSNIADTAENTDSIAKSMEITNEDLKYLRDIAETEAINRFTTAEIKVEMTNNNNVSSDMDLDGIVDYLANGVNEAMEKAAEGVHY